MIRPRDRLAALCSLPEDGWDLAHAALLVASAAAYPELDPRESLALLDELGRRAKERLGERTGADRALAMARFLTDDEGFDGDREDFGDPRNSFLNEVLDRRRGLPILLSLVYCEVGRRAGVPLEGVGLPGHFVVRVPFPAGVFLDPFHRGEALSLRDCARRVEEATGKATPLTRRMLRAATPRETIARVIRNLKGVYVDRDETDRAWEMADLAVCVDPEDPEERRDRGLLALQMGRFGPAAADLAAYLDERGGASDTKEIVEALRHARREIASLN